MHVHKCLYGEIVSNLALSGDKSLTKVLQRKSTHTHGSVKGHLHNNFKGKTVCESVPVEATCSVTDAESSLGLEETHTHTESKDNAFHVRMCVEYH